MRNKYINDFIENEEIQDFFLVKENRGIKQNNNGNKFYGSIRVGDKTNDIECKVWDIYNKKDINTEEYEKIVAGNIVKIKGKIDDRNQINVELIRLANSSDVYDDSDLYRVAPVDPNILYNRIIQIINKEITDIEYKTLCINLYTIHKEKLLYWPAAMKNHHAYKGGLLWHTYRMLQIALKLVEIYKSVNKSLLLSGIVLHDIGKISELSYNNSAIEYTLSGKMLGHLLIGTMMINNEIRKIKMDNEKKLLLEHMIASHHGIPEWDAIKKPCILEAYLLHMIDMIDSNVEKIENSLERINPGEFDKEKSFDDIHYYKPTFFDDNYLKGE